jgi:hypothetical protein
VPNPGTVTVLRVIATTEPRTRTTINTAKISTMTTRLWPMGARCADGRRGHSCGRGAGPRSRRRWRSTPGGSLLLGSRYACLGSDCRGVPDGGDDESQPPASPPARVQSSGARRSAPPATSAAAGRDRCPDIARRIGYRPPLALRHHGGCERIGDAMNAGLSVLVPLLIMFFALSMERVEFRLCARPRSEQAEELLTSRVHRRRLPSGHDSRPRSAPSD